MKDTAKRLAEIGKDKLDSDKSKYACRFPDDYEAEFARYMYFAALADTRGDRNRAIDLLNDIMGGTDAGATGPYYTKLVGTDTANGWDKVRHFVRAAHILMHHGHLAADVAGYGKESFDFIERLLGKDPEGFSGEDIYSDNLGEAFALALRAAPIEILEILLTAFDGFVAFKGSLVFCIEHGFVTITTGSHSFSAAGREVARRFDVTSCNAIIETGSGTVLNEQPAAMVGDLIDHGGIILTGVPAVMIE